MFSLLAVRNFLHKPWRSALLFLGFGMGVSVMIVLLSIGEAMVTQAKDERLVGGGDVTVLPEGIGPSAGAVRTCVTTPSRTSASATRWAPATDVVRADAPQSGV